MLHLNTSGSGSAPLCPRGRKHLWMNGNSFSACPMLENLGCLQLTASCFFTAHKQCQKQSWCFAEGKTFEYALISKKSLSLSESVTNGLILHSSQKCWRNSINIFCLPPLCESFGPLGQIKHQPRGIPASCTSPNSANSSQFPVAHFPEYVLYVKFKKRIRILTGRVKDKFPYVASPAPQGSQDWECQGLNHDYY